MQSQNLFCCSSTLVCSLRRMLGNISGRQWYYSKHKPRISLLQHAEVLLYLYPTSPGSQLYLPLQPFIFLLILLFLI